MSKLLFWTLPSLIALAIYWPGLFAWFQQDDFAWLGLIRDVREGGSVLDALLSPSQHGTWRPLSERAFFLFFPWAFGYESWPMRMVAFLTQCGSLVLVQRIMLRLTGVRWAALLAPILWIANSKMTIAMISNGAYTHVLCGFLLLAALAAWIEHRLTWMWLAYGLGFGAMETNVVLPALVSLHVLLLARHRWRQAVWLWPVALAYYGGHMVWAPKMAEGSYRMFFDASLVSTLSRYWSLIFAPENLTAFTGIPEPTGLILMGLTTALLLWSAPANWRNSLLVTGWFVTLLAPVLPLRDHVTGYYLTIPLAAVGMTLALAAIRSPRLWAPVLALYLVINVPCAYRGTSWWQARSTAAKRLVQRVWLAHRLQPGKVILLEGVTDEQFWSAVAHYPFVEKGKTYVFLEPSSTAVITGHSESGIKMKEFFLSQEELIELEKTGNLLRLSAATARP